MEDAGAAAHAAVLLQTAHGFSRVFYHRRQAFYPAVQRTEKVIPVNRDHCLRLHLIERLFEKPSPALSRVLRDAADPQEQDVCTDTVQLSFQIIIARADQASPVSVRDQAIERSAFLAGWARGASIVCPRSSLYQCAFEWMDGIASTRNPPT